ncbi:ATP-grasp domain-containing protein [Candidatus Dependentiae bacterium]|nr:ATP-grasp domain-containing protein [Candidatus Dependentiae bacterium]
MNSLRVGVLMGGRGLEREVSFNSGRTICDHLDNACYTIIPLYQRSNGTLYLLPLRFLHRGKTSDFEHRLDAEAEKISWDSLKTLTDFIYIALHGQFAEDGTLQGFLELLQIPYLGSKVFASALSMDKALQKEFLKHEGVEVPAGITVHPHELDRYSTNPELLIERLKQEGIDGPYIVKPRKEGSSLGISVVFDNHILLEKIKETAFIHPAKAQSVIIEEYLTGMEFSCITITDHITGSYKSLPPTEIVPEVGSHFFDYEQKYMPGRALKFTPARCSSEMLKKIQETCIKAMKILGIQNISRIDGFVKANGSVVIIDPNSLCGMGPSSFLFRQAAESNMSHSELINYLIKTELLSYGILSHEQLDLKKEASVTVPTKKRVGVILGGRSHEKETSLESGRNVIYKLSSNKYDIKAFFLDEHLELYEIDQSLLVRSSTKEITLGLTPSRKRSWNDLPQLIDFAFNALHGGEGENGCVQGALEMLALPYNGSSVLTSSLCMDKYKTNNFLRSQGFTVPDSYLLSKKDWNDNKQNHLKAVTSKLSFPLIVKPHDDGCSILVSKIHSEHELCTAVDEIFFQGKAYALIEKCITGMELTVGVIGNTYAQALPPSQSISQKGILTMEEKFLPGAGENQTPALLSEESLRFVMKTMEEVYTALNCKGYARIDCFYQKTDTEEKLIVLEVNTLPALTPATCIFHQAAENGISPMEFIDMIIQLGFEEHASVQADCLRTTIRDRTLHAFPLESDSTT